MIIIIIVIIIVAVFKCKLKTYLFHIALKAYPAWYSILSVLLIKFIIIIINILFC